MKNLLLIAITILAVGCGGKDESNTEIKPVEEKVLEVLKNQKCEWVLHDKKAGDIIDDSIDLEVLAQGFEIAEGPLWVASKKMFLFSDVKGNKIYSWTEEAGLNTFLSPGGHTEIVPYFEGGVLGSNGLALDLDGNLIICQHGDRRLAKLSFDNVCLLYTSPSPRD